MALLSLMKKIWKCEGWGQGKVERERSSLTDQFLGENVSEEEGKE